MNAGSRSAYTYFVLRYVHDIGTGEFLNVGVVLASPQSGYLSAKFKTAYGRVKKAFPSVDPETFRSRMRRLQATFDAIAEGNIATEGVRSFVNDSGAPMSDVSERKAHRQSLAVQQLIHNVIPPDDSSFQWSPPGSGLSKDLPATLTSLYQRFVTKYDYESTAVQRKDEDVWKNFRTELERRNVLGHLREKVIAVEDDAVKFEHAWKNGAWHCYEPLSFDLASDASIKEKAHRWLGQVASVQGATEQFAVYFLVGGPSDPRLSDAYDQAISILRKTPLSTVVEEEQATEFSDALASAISEHDARLL